VNQARTVVVLAAGEGKRMRSALPKVLHPMLGRPMLGHVLAAAQPLGAGATLVVVGHGAEQVAAYVAQAVPEARSVLQPDPKGTGQAVRLALEAVPDAAGTVVVINGDAPLLRPASLRALVEAHEAAGVAATTMSAQAADPFGLGRIVRDGAGDLARVVEQRDATTQEAAISEINAGVYAFEAAALREALAKLSTDNAQGEEYLTDVFGLLVGAGQRVAVHPVDDPEEALGCNDRAQLADLCARLRGRVNLGLMRSGVTMVDPATTWIDVTVTVEPDATVEPNTQLRGSTSVGAGALVGPDTTLTDVVVGEGAQVVRTHGSEAWIGPGASVGPYAFLRPGTVLAEDGKIGTFVETKNARIGRAAKVPHLSYVGDATIGEHANIGAGTIFANYDGVSKNHSTVGDAAFVGSDSVLIAPVRIGDGAYVAAGSAISKDVAPGELAVTRVPQRAVAGWVERKRAGTRSAEAAARATQRDRPADGQ
jgi:bifunctional UDP-N-acetylglucosamine pyrophosphorylase/glucosamine-1-phosphate N-acetyltransferase